MTASESRAAFSLAGIFSLRMFGLFLILPVFAIYADNLQGVTPVLVGVAIGAYGLTQAFLQIPFGLLSDRIGRKPVIIGGLIIFAIGSLVAAGAESIWGVILGRAIQGSGAIAAAVMALAADLTREQNRTKAMAVIGMSIGFAFASSLVLGPVLNSWVGVPGIFLMTAVLALLGIVMVIWVVPNPSHQVRHRDAEALSGQFARVLSDVNLLRLDAGILILHMILTSVFISVPLALQDMIGLDVGEHWMVYLPVVLFSMIFMIPFVVIAEKRRKMKSVYLSAIGGIALALLGMFLLHASLWGLVGALLLFFTAFNLLEATLPSLISKVAPAESKGTAMGVYSTSQFAGAFFGGLLGGVMHSYFGLEGVFLFAAVAAMLWLLIASGMAKPTHYSNYLLKVGKLDQAQANELQRQLLDVAGVEEAAVVAEEGVAYLKIDQPLVDFDLLDEFSVET